MTSNKYIIKTYSKGVKVLTINDLKSNLYSLQHLCDNEDGYTYSEGLGLSTSDSHIIIAATQNELVNGKFKSRIQVMTKPIAEIWEEEQTSLADRRDPSVTASHS